MKKLLIASAVSVAMFSASMAQADALSGALTDWEDRSYAQVKLGFVDVGTSDDAIGLTGTVGMDVPSIKEYLAFEADLMTTIVDGESSVSGAKLEASAWGLGGYAVFNYNNFPAENFTPYARLGLSYTSFDVTGSYMGYSASGEADGFDLAFGIGMKYAVNDKLGAVVEFNSTGLDAINAGVSYRF